MMDPFGHFYEKFGTWLLGSGPDNDIVISSRVRLVRNIKNSVFPHRASASEKSDIIQRVFESCGKVKLLKGSVSLELDKISPLQRELLVERHLISRELVKNVPSAVVFDRDEIISIMINEEDHVRLQCLQNGVNIMEAYRVISKIDDELSRSLEFGFHPEFGYLSACPTNTGTGLRASVLIHIPAFVISERIGTVLNKLGQLGLAIRGFFGEGSSALGNFFQVSNQKTLGKSEEEIIQGVEARARSLAVQEREIREELLRESRWKLEDSVYRSYGILKNARLISAKEAMQHISLVRMGVDMGLIDTITKNRLNELLILIQRSHLMGISNISDNNALKRDNARAKIIRERIGNDSC